MFLNFIAVITVTMSKRLDKTPYDADLCLIGGTEISSKLSEQNLMQQIPFVSFKSLCCLLRQKWKELFYADTCTENFTHCECIRSWICSIAQCYRNLFGAQNSRSHESCKKAKTITAFYLWLLIKKYVIFAMFRNNKILSSA